MRTLGQNQAVFSRSAARGQPAYLFEQGIFIADDRLNHV
jgi:hypothetical protein